MRFWMVLLFVLWAPTAHASTWSLGTYDQAVLADSPELYWRLGETSGTTVADATTHGHAGTYAAGGQDPHRGARQRRRRRGAGRPRVVLELL